MPTLTDGTCPSCLDGASNTCSQMAFIGINGTSGGMSDRAVIHEDQIFKLPEGMDCDIGGKILHMTHQLQKVQF